MKKEIKKIETTFKVDEIVRLKVSPKVKFHIVEVQTQICYANTLQEWYTGRIYTLDNIRFGELTPHIKFERFNLIELEAIPDSKEIRKLEIAVQKLQMKKQKFIKNQDFEKAAALKDQERLLKDQLSVAKGE